MSENIFMDLKVKTQKKSMNKRLNFVTKKLDLRKLGIAYLQIQVIF